MIPVARQGAYELESRFTRVSEPSHVAVTFPVGAVLLTAAFAESASGVGYVDDKHAYQQGNPTVVPERIADTGRP
jgi:hypothetical protein